MEWAILQVVIVYIYQVINPKKLCPSMMNLLMIRGNKKFVRLLKMLFEKEIQDQYNANGELFL